MNDSEAEKHVGEVGCIVTSVSSLQSSILMERLLTWISGSELTMTVFARAILAY